MEKKRPKQCRSDREGIGRPGRKGRAFYLEKRGDGPCRAQSLPRGCGTFARNI
nr:MAG TPA: hypothetical protein [Caudoviricetes sp.]